jgi:hypothetical protein
MFIFNKLNRAQKWVLLFGFIIMSLSFMVLTPFGSYKPTETGFYISIIGAFGWAVTFGWLLNKYQKPPQENN